MRPGACHPVQVIDDVSKVLVELVYIAAVAEVSFSRGVGVQRLKRRAKHRQVNTGILQFCQTLHAIAQHVAPVCASCDAGLVSPAVDAAVAAQLRDFVLLDMID